MGELDVLIIAIRERIDYEALFSQYVELHGNGAERQALCAFHQERVPSMSVNIEDGLYFCHNPDCGARGDVFTFYQRVRSLSFREAVYELARRVGLDPERVIRENADANARAGRGASAPAADAEEVLNNFIATGRSAADLLGARSANTSEARGAEARGASTEQEHTIDEAIVDAMHQRLLSEPGRLEFLETRRGLTAATVSLYKLGFDGQRYYIPVRNERGECVNIRRYKPDARRSADKMISWRQGFGSARLFPIDMLSDSEPVYLFEGEMDCLLARQLGLNALTTTGGAGTWREQWNHLFTGRNVVICYDADDAGRVGSARVATQLISSGAATVKVVSIPLAEPVGADFTDYVVGHGHTMDDFLSLVEQTPLFRASSEPLSGVVGTLEPTELHLSQASRSEFYNMPVRMKVMVSGKTTAPFLVPREVRVGCPTAVRGTLKMCERCPIAAAGGPVTKRIEFESNDVLQFINVPDEKLRRAIKVKVGVPGKCGYARHDVLEAMNIEEMQLIPEIERTDEEAPYVTRAAYYMGHGLQTNRSYVMTGITVPEPKRQLATHLIHTSVQSQSNIDAFTLSREVTEALKVFRPTEGGVQGLWRHLGVIYDDLERHTRIYQRRDIMLALDLTFHSILQFLFQGERLTRGWTEALVIGDSRTGKTTIVARLLDYYGAGEFSTGENTSLAGLVGGLHQVGTSWALQWGRIPLNDRRLLVVDEAGNLPQDQISRMSSMRSSGIAEVIKVHTERTNARTRQFWISNPRGNRPLSSYTQGALAVKELIGAPEDIARFDMVVSAASDDVPLAVVNAEREAEEPAIFTRYHCHQRVMWAWSRSAEQVLWAEGAAELVLRLATEQGEKYKYTTEIPLVEPNEQRVKLARLAVASAALFFSSTDDFERIVVRREHVEFAHQFLELLYSKPSLMFTEYARQSRRRYELSAASTVERLIGRRNGALTAFMEQEQFTQRDLQEILGYNDRDELRAALTELRDSGFIRRVGSSFYVKTPAAIRWLRQRINAGGESRDHATSFAALMEEPLPEMPSW